MTEEISEMLAKGAIHEASHEGKGFSVKRFLGSVKGWQPEASHQPKEAQQARTHRALQDGRNSPLEGSHK